MPATATAISFGLNLFNNGTLTTDDLSMIATGTTPAPLRADGTSAFTASVSTAPPVGNGQGPRKKKGDRITKHDTVPAPVQPRLGRAGKQASQGIAPGEVVLQPFVVSPELTRG